MAKIIIDGVDYPMPDAFTIGHARIIKRYTGLTLQQVEEADSSDPDLIAAYCHLAIGEMHPGRSFAAIEAEVDKIQFAQLETPADEPEDEESPPAAAQNGNGGNADSSGLTSDVLLDVTPETNRLPTGTPV